MSLRPISRMTEIGRIGLVAASVVGSLTLGGASVAFAQDATPAATCTPYAGITEATPVDATPEASPAAAEAPAGSPADEATTAAATAVAENLKACVGDTDALQTLVTPNLVSSLGGYASIEDATADGFFTNLTFADAIVSNVRSYDDGSVSFNMQYMQGQYQVASEKWTIVDVEGEWKLNAIGGGDEPELDGDQVVVGVHLTETGENMYTIAPNRPSVDASDVLVIQAISDATNTQPHELIVLQLPEGKVAADLVSGAVSDSDVAFIGQVNVSTPGDSANMYLVGLPAGKYVLACFVTGPDGNPHAMDGMVADFEVTTPAT